MSIIKKTPPATPPKPQPPTRPNTNQQTPVKHGTPHANDDFETKNFSVRLIKPAQLKTAIDLTYNELVLKQLMIQVESEMERYHIMRVSLMREAASRDKSGSPQDADAVASQEAENLKIDNSKLTNDIL